MRNKKGEILPALNRAMESIVSAMKDIQSIVSAMKDTRDFSDLDPKLTAYFLSGERRHEKSEKQDNPS